LSTAFISNFQRGKPPPLIYVGSGEFGAQENDQARDAIPNAGTYIVTLQCEGEPFPASRRAHLTVGFKG